MQATFMAVTFLFSYVSHDSDLRIPPYWCDEMQDSTVACEKDTATSFGLADKQSGLLFF